MRTRRADGVATGGVPSYRRVMPYLMRRRAESTVYFEQLLDVSSTLAFLESKKVRAGARWASIFDLLVWASVRTLARYPHMNRFVAGGRLYDRDGIWISYSAKRELVDGSPLVVVKRRFSGDASLSDVVEALDEDLSLARRGHESRTDRELDLVAGVAGLPLRGLLALERLADAFGVLPRSFVENDPMFSSLFIANVGSFGMDAPFHHLYEYGTISTFCAMGRVVDRVHVIEGRPVVRPTLPLRFSFDERVEDGLHAHLALGHLAALMSDPEGPGGERLR